MSNDKFKRGHQYLNGGQEIITFKNKAQSGKLN